MVVVAVIMWINTVLHEVGHAIARLCVSKADVTVFLGSYGHKEKSWRLRIGRLEIWGRKNILKWWGGLCVGDANISTARRVIVLLAGPFASLVLCAAMVILLYQIGMEGPLAPVAFIAVAYAVFSLIANLVPNKTPIRLENGGVTYSDGEQLSILWKLRKVPAGYFAAAEHYNKKNFQKAAEDLEALIVSGCKSGEVFRLAANARTMIKCYDEADALYRQMHSRGIKENAEDRLMKGLLMIKTKRHEAAIQHIRVALVKDGLEKMNLNNIGFALTNVGRYEEAINYLSDAIARDPKFAYPYGNRSFAYLQLGRLEEGKADLDRAIALDPTPEHGYAHRNLGVYYLLKGDYEEAVLELEKAMERDPDIPGLDELLAEARLVKGSVMPYALAAEECVQS
jgi:tetratricopeptide (TPR) repeat protein